MEFFLFRCSSLSTDQRILELTHNGWCKSSSGLIAVSVHLNQVAKLPPLSSSQIGRFGGACLKNYCSKQHWNRYCFCTLLCSVYLFSYFFINSLASEQSSPTAFFKSFNPSFFSLFSNLHIPLFKYRYLSLISNSSALLKSVIAKSYFFNSWKQSALL